MDDIKSIELPENSILVASNALSAKQLAIYVAQIQLTKGLQVWEEPSVSSYQPWICEVYSTLLSDKHNKLLNAVQVRALWQKIIESSPASESLIGTDNLVDWAIDASRKLSSWMLKRKTLESWSDSPEVKSFCRWAENYEEILKTEGWIDTSEAEFLLRNSNLKLKQNKPITWVDIDSSPAQKSLFENFIRTGTSMKTWQSNKACESTTRTRFAGFSEEVEASARWAKTKLTENPNQRLALVIPTLSERREETYRIIRNILSPGAVGLALETKPGFFDLSGNIPQQDPIIGSALTVLDLFGIDGGFNELSRWLRSPFFVDNHNQLSQRAVLESGLRLRMEVQLKFLDAFERGGLAEHLRSVDPELASLLEGAVKLINGVPNRSVPSDWVQIWERLLRQLCWQQQRFYPEGLALWESALNEFVQLTPVLGEITAQVAIKELRRILSGQTRTGPLPVNGLFLLQRLEDVGFGYNGIWATGLTDSYWPIPASPNPILPLTLQISHGMPLASPGAALEYSNRITRRLLRLAPETILSWSSMSDEESNEPSPLILPYREISNVGLLDEGSRLKRSNALKINSLEVIRDDAPSIQEKRIFGGSYTLDMQSKCPFRAFFQGRLGALAPEKIIVGLSPKHRGIAIHRAMEFLFDQKPSQSELKNWTKNEREAKVASSVDQALGTVFGKTRTTLKNMFNSEYQRMEMILNTFIEVELKRSAFEISAIEEKMFFEIGGLKIDFKIDRLDKLGTEDDNSELVIIDYKTGTGSSPSPSNWFKGQPRDIQLPLYALAVKGNVGGIVVSRLTPDKARYSGYWQSKETFPGRPNKLPENTTWITQLSVWQTQIEQLAQEYAQGDSRLFEDNLDEAKKTFAPLTRVYEQVALAKLLVDGYPNDS